MSSSSVAAAKIVSLVPVAKNCSEAKGYITGA